MDRRRDKLRQSISTNLMSLIPFERKYRLRSRRSSRLDDLNWLNANRLALATGPQLFSCHVIILQDRSAEPDIKEDIMLSMADIR